MAEFSEPLSMPNVTPTNVPNFYQIQISIKFTFILNLHIYLIWLKVNNTIKYAYNKIHKIHFLLCF